MPFLPVDKDAWKEPCRSREHNPPTMIVLANGVHKWQCPSCGHITTVVVNRPTFFCVEGFDGSSDLGNWATIVESITVPMARDVARNYLADMGRAELIRDMDIRSVSGQILYSNVEKR